MAWAERVRDLVSKIWRDAAISSARDLLVLAGLAAVLVVGALTLPARVSIDGFLLLFPPVVAVAAIWRGVVATTVVAVLGLLLILAGLPAPRDTFPTAAVWLYLSFSAIAAFFGEWALRRRREREALVRVLEEREAHLRSIFDTAPEAMIVINHEGVVQSYGLSAERMFGWRAEDVLGRNISMLMPQPYREHHNEYLNRYLSTGEKRIIGIGRIVVGERKDGSQFPMELAVGEVQAAGARMFTGFVRDLTERQKSEARLRELQAEVVHISRVSAMGEMASALAHELNQPLSAIANYLNGAKKLIDRGEGAGPKVSDAIVKAADQALRAGDIIRRLRDFLARGEGERQLESLAKLLHEACNLALVGAKQAGVDVVYRIDPHRDRVIVDRVQIQQVIVNLVRNALDATEGQTVRHIEVVTTVEKGMAKVSIADNGPGLDPQVAQRLFQPFLTTKANGMGVGLSICRTIVEAHGGRICGGANEGGGALFSFTVPLAENEEAP